jgi:hypothetical protein
MQARWFINATTIAAPFAFYWFILSSLTMRPLLLWIPLMGISFGGNLLRQLPLLRLRYSLVQSMLPIDDIMLLGPLIGCVGLDEYHMVSWPSLFPTLCGKPARLSEQINQSIIRTVSLLHPDDEIDFTNLERSILPEALRSNSTDLVLALLRLLQQCGDGRELSSIRSLAKGQYSGSENPAVREAAARCMYIIEARQAVKAQPGTLLRASQSSAQISTLVRPVAGIKPEDHAVLLRVGNGEE